MVLALSANSPVATDLDLLSVMPRKAAYMAILACVLLAAGCTGDPGASGDSLPTPTSSIPTAANDQPEPRAALPTSMTSVVDGATPAALALATSLALFVHSPAVVLAAEDDGASQTRAATTAIDLGVPLLLTPSGTGAGATELTAELTRLAPNSVVTVGAAATAWAQRQPGTPSAGTPAAGVAVVPDLGDGGVLPAVTPAAPLDELLVLALDRPETGAALATARAAGARVLPLANPDPRVSDATIKALAGQSTERVLAIGGAFGPAEQLRRRINTAATGILLPGGGQVLFPGRRLIALYGHPGDTRLGSLGEQSLTGAIARARTVAASYRSLVREPVVPCFEIIATVASSGAGTDGNYSNETAISHLKPWVDAARKAGIYVVLDLQPGRTDFLTQAKRYEQLLREPHVGLALDPEWRLKPGQRHLVQIGSVTAAEINKTGAWLAELTRQHNLPQKVLLLHQFRLDMIPDRANVRTDYDELRVIIHADGFGSAGEKFNTWRNMQLNPPPAVWWGWKNFYDEDKPTFTPRQTVAVKPSPVYVSYQ